MLANVSKNKIIFVAQDQMIHSSVLVPDLKVGDACSKH